MVDRGRVAQFAHSLVDGKNSATGEQDNGYDKRPEIGFAGKPEGMKFIDFLAAFLMPMKSSIWFIVSAEEWTASASTADEAVTQATRNLTRAMNRLALKAAKMTDFELLACFISFLFYDGIARLSNQMNSGMFIMRKYEKGQ